MRLTLVRHGETASNVGGVLDTAPPGPGLTERGLEQAASLVERFAAQRFDAIWRSAYTRTRITAEPIATDRRMTPRILDDLGEFSVGSLEGRSDPEAIAIFVEVLKRWILGELELSMAGGETGAAILTRMDRAIRQVEQAAVDDAGGGLTPGRRHPRPWLGAGLQPRGCAAAVGGRPRDQYRHRLRPLELPGQHGCHRDDRIQRRRLVLRVVGSAAGGGALSSAHRARRTKTGARPVLWSGQFVRPGRIRAGP